MLVGLALLVFASVVFFVLGRSLWRRSKALFAELGAASDQLAAVSAQIQELSRRSEETEQPAVFQSPSELRQARVLSRPRSRGSESGRQRLR